ncbi:MAG: glutamate racemase [Thermodesulfovibrionales bacterium]|nr:glutamate racemase [Thermodesulfovibrionales bacterium]
MNNSPIGVFDSGIGGLTVLKEIFRVLPSESTIYLGDTARVPYGIRSSETVTRYSFENTRFLTSKGIKLLVVACNTVSSISLEAIRKSVSVPVIGVIEPGAKAAIEATRTKRIGIIGTEGTIKSNSYVNAINALRNNKTEEITEHGEKSMDRYFEIRSGDFVIFTKACPLFVSLAEEGWTANDVALLTAEHYLRGLKKERLDTLILGCTHYPVLKDIISKVMGTEVTLIDSAVETVMTIKDILKRENIERSSAEKPSREFYVTDSPGRFIKVGERFLQQKIEHIKKIEL